MQNQPMQATPNSPGRLMGIVCAGHGARLAACESPDQVFVEPKVRRRVVSMTQSTEPPYA